VLERTRSLACESKKAHELVTTGPPKRSGLSCANGFNGLLRALLGDRAFLPPSQAAMPKHRRPLDISVEMSGSHDFAVRLARVRLAQQAVHRIPQPNVRDDRETPLGGPGTPEEVPVICPTSQAKMSATNWHDGQISSRRFAARIVNLIKFFKSGSPQKADIGSHLFCADFVL
jgi:hypothetical protein